MKAEGWYEDPFEAHEARWFSDGSATFLVRDGRQESRHEPPVGNYVGELTPVTNTADWSDFSPASKHATRRFRIARRRSGAGAREVRTPSGP